MESQTEFTDLLNLGHEHRSHPRAFVTISVSLEINDTIYRGAECRNISMGGMFIFTNQLFPSGTSGILTLTKRCGDNRYSFSAAFSVVRVEESSPRGSGIGIYIKQISKHDLQQLTAIVNFHLSVSIKEKLVINCGRAKGFTFKIAQTKEELEGAFKLVHDSYVREGYMDPDPSGIRVSLFNAFPQTTTFIGVKGGQIVMATTLFPDSFLGLPMDNLYSQELRLLRDEKRYVAEIGAFSVDKDFRDSNPSIPLHIQKTLYMYSRDYLGIDDLVITINPKHRLYYQYLVLFEQIGEERAYDSVNNAPAIAMRLNISTIPERMKYEYGDLQPEKNLYDFLCVSACESIHLPLEQKPLTVWNRDLIHYFFEDKTDLFKKSDRRLISMILALYP